MKNLLDCELFILSWRNRRAATKRELQSLVGLPSHAAFVVIPGRTFLRQMINLISRAELPHHHLRLNSEFRSDLLWWASFLPLWNGRSMLPPEEPAHTLTSDASGSWGCGAVTEADEFFQVKWPDSWAQVNIAVKEMVPVVIAVATWGCRWGPCTLLVRSDNMSVMCALSAGSARDPALMHQLRCLHFFTAQYQIAIKSRHLARSRNLAADALSRNNISSFRVCTPQAAREPTQIAQPLLDLLVHNRPNWISADWRTMFLTTWEKP